MVTRPCQRRANGLSAPPPADRRGIAGGGAYPRCRGEPAGRERLILWKTKRKRKKMDDFVTEFNEKMAAKSREVCERIEREDAERRSKLGETERQILDMWPRFEDGEYVWFGDEVEMQDEIVREVWTFTLDVNAEGDKRLYLNGFQGLFVLPGERVKRPAPKVLDADGVEIKVGDTVWTLDGLEGVVTKVEDGAACIAYESDYAQRKEADNLTHARPDSWERLEEDAEKIRRDIAHNLGDFSPSDFDDERDTVQFRVTDLVRRAKALAGVEVARDED